MAVLSYHLSQMMGQSGFGNFAEKVTWRGDLGVDFFFVLSGFIITFAHGNDVGSPAKFWSYLYRRGIRLFPVYWSCLVMMVAGLALFGQHNTPPSGIAQWAAAITLVRISGDLMPIHPAWTLVHEMAFYAAFAIMIVSKRFCWGIFSAWMAWCLASFHYVQGDFKDPLATYSSAINLNFGIGMLAYWLYDRQWRPYALVYSGLAAFIATYALDCAGAKPSPLLYALALGALISGLASIETLKGMPVPKWLSEIGNASYVLYLMHEMIVLLFLRTMKRIAPNSADFIIYFSAFFLTVLCALAIHHYLEKPLLRTLRYPNNTQLVTQ